MDARKRSGGYRHDAPAIGVLLVFLSSCSGEPGGSELVEPEDAGRRLKDQGALADAGEGPPDGSTVEDAEGDAAAGSDADFAESGPIDTGVPAVDTDLDGIPDGEDPARTTSNAILFGDAFDALDTAWLFTSVEMRVDTSVGLLRAAPAEPFVRVGWVGPQPTWADVFIRTSIRVNEVGRSTSDGAGIVGLLGRTFQVIPNRYLLCGLDVRQQRLVLSEHSGGNVGTTIASAPLTILIGQWTDLTFEIAGRFLTCRAGGVEVMAESTLYISGSAGFRAWDISFDADYFQVYDL